MLPKFVRYGDAAGRDQYNERIVVLDPRTEEGIGYVDISYYLDKIFVNMIEVYPQHRGQGYGRMLLEEVKRGADDQEIIMAGDFATQAGQRLWASFVAFHDPIRRFFEAMG